MKTKYGRFSAILTWHILEVYAIYYILNGEIQEFLVKIKMLFLRYLKVFISYREINLCRLDIFPIMVANKSSMYNRVPAFRTTLDSTLQLQLYTSLRQTQVAFYDCEKDIDAENRNGRFYFKAWSVFQGCTTECFCEFPHSMWHGNTSYHRCVGFSY